jgi:hypothetical protein
MRTKRGGGLGSPIWLLAATIIMVGVAALPAEAVGPDGLFDGIWFISETGPGVGPPTYYASVHQNGSAVAAFLLATDGSFIYVVGTRSGSTVQGTIHTSSGQSAGTFTVTATGPNTLVGQSTFGGLTTPLVGTKIF